MSIKYLAKARDDMTWFRRYYTRNFPEGRTNANIQLRKALAYVSTGSGIGTRDETDSKIIIYPIPRTPFTVMYRIKSEDIEIMRVYDQRSDFSNRHLKPSDKIDE